MRAWRLLAACLALLLAGGGVGAQDLRPVPVLSASVIDQTGTLTRAQISALEAKLAAFERDAGSQLVVLVVASTQPEDIASYAQRVGDAWKLGRREVGDGLIILVAKDDRKVRIEVAKALEGAVPDLAARQIIDRALTPAFRAGDFAGGLNAAIDQLAARIRGEGLPAPGPRAAKPGAQWQDFALFFLLAVPIAGAVLTGVLGRKLGTLATGAGAGGLAWAVTASLLVGGAAALVALVLVGVLGLGAARRRGLDAGGHGVPPFIGGGWGGGGGGGGGGGFSSGGGGDFGGGGASGDW
ncbi:TPM domain-containing protein [Methylibium sp.]|uniref:TPM domain-containing protein n=1 Tax=Methylibium sp. TaxID=2067992 RepID=UPI003D11B232